MNCSPWRFYLRLASAVRYSETHQGYASAENSELKSVAVGKLLGILWFLSAAEGVRGLLSLGRENNFLPTRGTSQKVLERHLQGGDCPFHAVALVTGVPSKTLACSSRGRIHLSPLISVVGWQLFNCLLPSSHSPLTGCARLHIQLLPIKKRLPRKLQVPVSPQPLN